jgi:hypothetical protein
MLYSFAWHFVFSALVMTFAVNKWEEGKKEAAKLLQTRIIYFSSSFPAAKRPGENFRGKE